MCSTVCVTYKISVLHYIINRSMEELYLLHPQAQTPLVFSWTAWPWRGRHYDPPKRRQGVSFQTSQSSISLHSRTQTPHHHSSIHASTGTTHLEDAMTTLLDRQYKSKQDRHCTYNVTMGGLMQPLLQWKRDNYYIFWVYVYRFVLEGLHHEALEDNCLRMNVSATVYKIVKMYITRWS